MRGDATDLRDRGNHSMSIAAQTPAETQVEGTRESSLREEVPEAPREQPPIRLDVRERSSVFGADAKAALETLAAGAGRDETYEKPGDVVGSDDASFEVSAGANFDITGLSSSEQSITISLFNRLTEVTGGAILLDGHDLAQMLWSEPIEVRSSDMGVVSQSLALMRPPGGQCRVWAGSPRQVSLGVARENPGRIGVGGFSCRRRSISA